MKSILYTTAIICLIGGLTYFNMPWWMVAVGGCVAGALFAQNPLKAYAVGFGAGFVLWWGVAMFYNARNGGMLAAKVGEIFQGLQGWHLLAVTGTIGGLLAGFGMLVGLNGRRLFTKK